MKMLYARFKTAVNCFREDTRGSFMVESVIVIPLLFIGIAATFEFFEVHRYKSAREKATYTVADMISREQAVPGAISQNGLTSTYLDNALVVFDEIARDGGVNQIRISIVQYNLAEDIYEVAWSQVRGDGPPGNNLGPLTTDDTRNDHSRLPVMDDGEQVILVESSSLFEPLFGLALDDLIINTRMFTAIRFDPRMCYEGVCSPPGGTADTSDDDDAASNS